jgi:hypothetical protein
MCEGVGVLEVLRRILRQWNKFFRKVQHETFIFRECR